MYKYILLYSDAVCGKKKKIALSSNSQYFFDTIVPILIYGVTIKKQ